MSRRHLKLRINRLLIIGKPSMHLSYSLTLLLLCPLSDALLLRVADVNIIDPMPDELIALPEPGVFGLVALGLLAAVLGRLDVRGLPQDAGLHERTDVH